MAKVNHFFLLLWKNYLLQRRKVIVTCLEIGLPTLFAVILILIRQRVESQKVDVPTTWETFKINNTKNPGFYTQLYYSPNTTNLTSEIMEKAVNRLHWINSLHGFANENEATDAYLELLEISDFFALVSFVNLPKDGEEGEDFDVKYKIRFPSVLRSGGQSVNPLLNDKHWNTELMFPMFQKVGPRSKDRKTGGPPDYFSEGFLPLQYAIDMAIVEVAGRNSSASCLDLRMQRMSYPPYLDDNFVLVIQQQFPMIIMLSFIFYSMQIIKDLVYEKEQKLKESMKMMGLSGWLHWLAWFVKYIIFIVISIAIETALFCINTGAHGRVIGYTSPSVLFVFLLLYGITTISFCFALSTFFSKANSSSAIGGLVFFLSYLPYSFLQPRYDTLPWMAKIVCCLLPNVAMALGTQVIGMFEGTGAGAQWSTLNRSATVDDDFTMLHVMVMLIVDACICAVIAWYMEAVFPGDFGIPQPVYFPFQKSYWCGMHQVTDSEDGDDDCHALETDPLLGGGQGPPSTRLEFFDRDPCDLRPGVQIRNLRKEFKSDSGTKVAVAGMTLNLYEGQITALLGHNGAGKTTTMSILTGFFPPTSGTAIINGYDILKDIGSVRNSLGLCPQHNILFDDLTVEEHLIFFIKLKEDHPKELVKSEVERILIDIDLVDKRKSLASTLSGGMKRRLSVGIALSGGSKVVILDEPSSGLDPNARHHLWDLLLRNRSGRTILLSTHFMDEADTLGDRIAIMADGVIQCCGTSLFLKMKYGAGYHLTIVKQPNCDTSQITNVVQKVIPEARMESNVGMELCYILPFESKGNFEHLFNVFDEDKDRLAFSSYGISVTTMEEVFLRAGGSVDEAKPLVSLAKYEGTPQGDAAVDGAWENTPLVGNGVHRSGYSGEPLDFSETPRRTGLRLLRQQFGAMFIKRVLHTTRNWVLTVSQLLVPLVFTIIALVVLRTLPSGDYQPLLILDMSKLADAVVVYGIGSGSPAERDLSGEYVRVLKSFPSLSFVDVSNDSRYDNDSNPVDQYIIDQGVQDLGNYNKHFLIALDFSSNFSSSLVHAVAYFSNQAFHASAISLNAIDNAIYRSATGNSTARIITTNHPLPERVQDSAGNQFALNIDGFGISINAVFGMSFLTSSFVLFLIRERASKAKHSQFISGVDFFVFWTSTLLWDMMNYIVPCIGMIVAYAAFGIDAYVGGGRWANVLLLFGWAALPFMYLLSFIFKVPSTGFIWLTILNILTGIATLMAVVILSIPELGTQNLAKSLEWVFLVFLPNYCLGQGLEDFYSNYEFNKICTPFKSLCEFDPTAPCCSGCKNNCITYNEAYLGIAPNGIGRMLVFLACQGFCYFGILLLLESNAQKRIFYIFRSVFKSSVEHRQTQRLQPPEDDDVTNERMRINEAHLLALSASEAIILKDLTKRYGQFVAVDRICAGVGKAECFGLLGINGAGKTSTFQMLTGDAFISGGTAYVLGHDLKKDFDKIQYEIGYCPQFDALIEQLTGWETLRMYANLRGLDRRTMEASINSLVDALLLRPHVDKLVKSYSGGTKRKLSTAIALIGRPRVIFLDEPSSGMDPTARRHLWNTLSRVRDAGRTLVLTSHSMEECEALCTRIAIMVNGQFRCLGSTQHLKSKFGKGYTLMIKVKSSEEQSTESTIRQIQESVEASFPGSILKDVHQGLLHFHITDPSVKLGRLFGIVESIRERFAVEDYSVSQTTLEQVFINFAQTQLPPEEAKSGRRFCEAKCGCGSCCGIFRRREVPDNTSTAAVNC